MEYVIINGEILKKEEAELTSLFWKKPFLITEKIWFGFGGVPLFAEKTEQLQKQLKALGAKIPDLFLNQREFFRRIKRMLNKNRFYRSGIIHFQLLISDSETDFVLFATPFHQSEVIYHEKGILISIADNHKYSKTPLTGAKSLTQIFNLLEKEKNVESPVQGFIFLNEKGVICDAGDTNIFLIKKNVLMTPSPETGCTSDNFRKPVLEAAGNLGLQVLESAEIPPEAVYKMDEVFFAGEETGIQWVLGIGTKRFVHPVSGQIHNELNKILKNKVH